MLSALEATVSKENYHRFSLELEGGPVWQSRNNVQIPNNENGTRFSLVDLIGKGPFAAGRLYLTWNINQRNGLRVLLAPFKCTESAMLEYPIDFEGETFDVELPLEATYIFNSWRITYTYSLHRSPTSLFRIGFTAKIRDAKVQLDQKDKSARKTDVGFVPLLHLSGYYRFSQKWRLLMDLDALAGGPGRAEDLAIKFSYAVNKHWSLSGGYRTVEGGADVEEVYNFAWLHYAVISVEYNF